MRPKPIGPVRGGRRGVGLALLRHRERSCDGGHAGTSSVLAVASRRCRPGARRPTGPSGRSWRSRCTGRSGRRWPRGSRPRRGAGLRSSSARAVSIIPGVQKPHCRPCSSMKPCCTGSSVPPCGHALDGAHLVPVGHRGERGARLHRLAVDQHHAGAAVAGVAPPVGAGQPERLAQEVHEQQPRFDVAGDLGPVDGHGDLHRRPPQAAGAVAPTRSSARRRTRRVSSSARCRL